MAHIYKARLHCDRRSFINGNILESIGAPVYTYTLSLNFEAGISPEMALVDTTWKSSR